MGLLLWGTWQYFGGRWAGISLYALRVPGPRAGPGRRRVREAVPAPRRINPTLHEYGTRTTRKILVVVLERIN